MLDLWDAPESFGELDNDELAPTLKPAKVRRETFDERVEADRLAIERQLRWGVAA